MIRRPLVTIIINTYNDAPLLPSAIESALSQTWPNLQILVYNNASTDNTSSIVRKVGDSRVELIESKAHVNLSTARNLALAFARGELVCFLDSDDTWHPKKVEIQVDVMRKSNADLSFTNFRFRDANHLRPPTFRFANLDAIAHSLPLEISYPAALSTIMFKISALAGNPFYESTHITGDYRLVTSLARHCKWKMIPQSLVTIARRSSGESATKVQLMVQELAAYSNFLRTEGESSASAYVALRVLEIGLYRGRGKFVTSPLFRQLIFDPRLFPWLPSYLFYRLKHSILLTR